MANLCVNGIRLPTFNHANYLLIYVSKFSKCKDIYKVDSKIAIKKTRTARSDKGGMCSKFWPLSAAVSWTQNETSELSKIRNKIPQYACQELRPPSLTSRPGLLGGGGLTQYQRHTALPTFLQQRNFCDSPRQSAKPSQLPRLMAELHQIAWPNIFKSIRNWILSTFIVTPYFDREFNIHEFVEASKQAVEFVSQSLAAGQYENLREVVSAEALQEIQNSIAKFSVEQRSHLAVSKDDIFFSFPYQVGVMFDEQKEPQQRFVEITMCYHVLKGLRQLQEQGAAPGIQSGTAVEIKDKVFILNYRFIREFTKGKDNTEWIVNVVNHYRPSDYV